MPLQPLKPWWEFVESGSTCLWSYYHVQAEAFFIQTYNAAICENNRKVSSLELQRIMKNIGYTRMLDHTPHSQKKS